ncbi:MAG: OmpH family outer membrane protein [Bacteroidaceae bacterium]
MKKTYLLACTFSGMLALTSVFSSCNKNQKDLKHAETSKQVQKNESKMAFVEIDSLMSQYQFCKDYTLLMTKKGEHIKATLQSKGQMLQRAAAEFQQKVQSGGFTQEQAMQQQAKLGKQQEELQLLQARLSAQFEEEQQKYNAEMRDSIQSFLKEYNKNYGFSFIISKAGDNLLYADPSLNITVDVINGLNKRYKPNQQVLGKSATKK